MEEILASAQAGFVALCRPFIREPSFAANLLEGRQTESRCTSCGICALAQERMPLRCHAGAVRTLIGA